VDPINSIAQQEIRKAFEKYNSYGSDWKKAYFDKYSGGFNVYHVEHKFSTTQGGGKAEKIVGEMLARCNGKQVEFLPEGNKKSPDCKFDGKTWDIKYINNANEETIRSYIKNAQKADNVIFYWNDNKEKLKDLRNAIIREVGRMKKMNHLDKMPDIYYLNNGLLKSLWKK
jgi:hypothetical protein